MDKKIAVLFQANVINVNQEGFNVVKNKNMIQKRKNVSATLAMKELIKNAKRNALD